jgi:hypothetical protein
MSEVQVCAETFEELIKAFFNLGVSIIIAILSFALGCGYRTFDKRKEARTERYSKLYAPFISYVYTFRTWDVGFSSLVKMVALTESESAGAIIKLLFDHAYLMGRQSQKAFDEFNKHYAGITVGNSQLVNNSFVTLAISLLTEADQLAKKLGLPQSAEYALGYYNQGRLQEEVSKVD